MDKALLRAMHRKRRQTWSNHARSEASHSIVEKAWNVIEPFNSIGLYISTDEEVDTRLLIERCFKAHKRVCVPKIVNHSLIFVEIKSLMDCELNPFGILEPTSSSPCIEPELQVIPMLAYNERKFRLGYGKGYYDQYLKTYSGQTLGLCFKEDFDNQLVEEPFDISCQRILTN